MHHTDTNIYTDRERERERDIRARTHTHTSKHKGMALEQQACHHTDEGKHTLAEEDDDDEMLELLTSLAATLATLPVSQSQPDDTLNSVRHQHSCRSNTRARKKHMQEKQEKGQLGVE